eukprot:m.382832 g.382832  ORF g.382832 m.382832 type:complete len:55 (+) comp20976_c0_seq19:2094-2258(+)
MHSMRTGVKRALQLLNSMIYPMGVPEDPGSIAPTPAVPRGALTETPPTSRGQGG